MFNEKLKQIDELHCSVTLQEALSTVPTLWLWQMARAAIVTVTIRCNCFPKFDAQTVVHAQLSCAPFQQCATLSYWSKSWIAWYDARKILATSTLKTSFCFNWEIAATKKQFAFDFTLGHVWNKQDEHIWQSLQIKDKAGPYNDADVLQHEVPHSPETLTCNNADNTQLKFHEETCVVTN